MERLDRIYPLDGIIKHSRYPVSKKRLETVLECSSATVERAIRDMRDYLGAPIVYHRNLSINVSHIVTLKHCFKKETVLCS